MRLKGLLLGTAFLLLLVLAAVCGSWLNDGGERGHVKEEESHPLTLLAPYEIYGHRQTLERVVQAYGKAPGKREVRVEYVSPDDLRREVARRLELGKNADLIICENTMMPVFIDMGILRDITANMAGGGPAAYGSSMWGNAKNDGKIYGVPLTLDPYLLYCNRDMLDRYGLRPPKTWDELEAACDRITGLGSYGFGAALERPEEAAAFYMQVLYSMGRTLRELDGAAGVDSLTLLARLKNRTQIPEESINWTQEDLTRKFAKGNIAMMAGKSSMATLLRSLKPEFGAEVLPMPCGVKPAYLLHGENLGITVTADYGDAFDFLQYLESQAVAETLADGLDVLPVKLQVPFHQKELGITMEFARTYRENGVSKGAFDSWPDISAALSGAVLRVMGEQRVSISETAAALQDEVRTAIIENGMSERFKIVPLF